MKKLKHSTDHFTGRERHALHHIKNRLARDCYATGDVGAVTRALVVGLS